MPLLSSACNLSTDQIRPKEGIENDELTGSYRLTEIHGHFLFSHILSLPLKEFRGETVQNVWIRKRWRWRLLCSVSHLLGLIGQRRALIASCCRKKTFYSEANSFSFTNLSLFPWKNNPKPNLIHNYCSLRSWRVCFKSSLSLSNSLRFFGCRHIRGHQSSRSSVQVQYLPFGSTMKPRMPKRFNSCTNCYLKM